MRRASSLWTRRVFAITTVVAVAGVAIAILLDLAGRPGERAQEAWLGVITLIATPALGLIATASEYAAVADRRTVLSSLGVLAILGLSLVVALLR